MCLQVLPHLRMALGLERFVDEIPAFERSVSLSFDQNQHENVPKLLRFSYLERLNALEYVHVVQ